MHLLPKEYLTDQRDRALRMALQLPEYPSACGSGDEVPGQNGSSCGFSIADGHVLASEAEEPLGIAARRGIENVVFACLAVGGPLVYAGIGASVCVATFVPPVSHVRALRYRRRAGAAALSKGTLAVEAKRDVRRVKTVNEEQTV